ncbi:zinc finger FYVE domain-containing protein 1-like protein [Lates japonicus]|uniref:Zinc finger FYVE domain-containing protein 1-like protein n=1 Tax=Lates japonicus TaxID=270547 RepID=A0AAD3N2U4_LATJO|nr:zinc finger FYVE domain-containing protein 1-like protein [Lates japonicus]
MSEILMKEMESISVGPAKAEGRRTVSGRLPAGGRTRKPAGVLDRVTTIGQTRILERGVAGVKVLIFGNTGGGRVPHPQPHPRLRGISEALHPELRALSSRCGLERAPLLSGSAVIVFQEAAHTPAAGSWPPTNYTHSLLGLGKQQVKNTHTAPRQPGIVFHALEALSESRRFRGELSDDKMTLYSFFPDEYFTCSTVCLSCNIRCKNGMNHLRDRVPHMADGLCQYAHQFNNKVLICKRGREVIVVPKTSASTDNPWFGLAKYAWSGYVLECASCGVIYRSRQYWMGNQDPESSVVRSEVKHVWEGRVLDGMNRDPVGQITAQPHQAVPPGSPGPGGASSWRPNTEITACHGCQKVRRRKHHQGVLWRGSHMQPQDAGAEEGWGTGPSGFVRPATAREVHGHQQSGYKIKIKPGFVKGGGSTRTTGCQTRTSPSATSAPKPSPGHVEAPLQEENTVRTGVSRDPAPPEIFEAGITRRMTFTQRLASNYVGSSGRQFRPDSSPTKATSRREQPIGPPLSALRINFR